jgi:DNA-directed RNA polymerase specialized sigma24 family protein/ribosome-associated translation inhibitor RaiA
MNLHITVQVPRSPDLQKLMDRLPEKLEPLLVAFQPELVQVQGRLVRHTSREGVNCRLNLHLPTTQLSSEETAATAQIAFRAASEDLVRQARKHVERLRENRLRKAPPSRPRANGSDRRESPAARRDHDGDFHAAQREQRRADMAGYFGAHYQQVRAFIGRQLQIRERMGELPPGQLETDEVLDEMVMTALESAATAPPVSRGRWLLMLAVSTIRKLVKAGSDRPHGVEHHTLTSDPRAMDEPDPEEVAATVEMMDQLAAALRPLPAAQRHDLILYLLEGFRPQELAELSHRTPAEVETSLHQAEAALRAKPGLSPMVRQRLRLAPQAV